MVARRSEWSDVPYGQAFRSSRVCCLDGISHSTHKWAAHNETLATHRRTRYDGISSTYSATLHASTCIKDGDSTAEDKNPFDAMVDQAGSGAISEARHPTH